MKLNFTRKILLASAITLFVLQSETLSAINLSIPTTSTKPASLTIPINSFVVVKGENTQDAIMASKALETAEMEMYRLRDSRRTLTFKNGVVIELLSAKELKAKGVDINLDSYNEVLPKGYVEPTYLVNDKGQLIQLHEKQNPGKF